MLKNQLDGRERTGTLVVGRNCQWRGLKARHTKTVQSGTPSLREPTAGPARADRRSGGALKPPRRLSDVGRHHLSTSKGKRKMNDLQEFNVKMTTIEVERESIEDLHRRIEELECVTAGIWATLQEKDYFAAAELARMHSREDDREYAVRTLKDWAPWDYEEELPRLFTRPRKERQPVK